MSCLLYCIPPDFPPGLVPVNPNLNLTSPDSSFLFFPYESTYDRFLAFFGWNLLGRLVVFVTPLPTFNTFCFGLASPVIAANPPNNAVFLTKLLTPGFAARVGMNERAPAAILPLVPSLPRILPAPTIAFLAIGDLAAIFFAPA